MTKEYATTYLRCSGFSEEQIKEISDALKEWPKMGHWIFDEVLDRHYYCSECKSMGVDYWDYCPNCGAKMQEGGKE